MNRQTHLKINRKVTLFIEHSRTKKSKYCCHPPFHPPIFCRHSLKLLSPTLPKLMNWILLSPPLLSSDPDTPPKRKIWNVHLLKKIFHTTPTRKDFLDKPYSKRFAQGVLLVPWIKLNNL